MGRCKDPEMKVWRWKRNHCTGKPQEARVGHSYKPMIKSDEAGYDVRFTLVLESFSLQSGMEYGCIY